MGHGIWEALPVRMRRTTRTSQHRQDGTTGGMFYNAERQLWAFYSESARIWWIARSHSCSYKFFPSGEGDPSSGGILLERQAGTYFGRPFYAAGPSARPRYCLFYSVANTWIIREGTNIPNEPRADLEPDGETWEGDGFYDLTKSPPFPGDSPVECKPAGALLNAADPASGYLYPWWPRWERQATNDPAPCGTYVAADQDGAPDIRIGSPTWESEGRLYVRSAERIGGNYTYGPIRYEESVGAWCVDGNTSIRGPEPPEGGQAVYKIFDKSGVDTGVVAFVLSWNGLVAGTGTKSRLVAEMFGWRT